MFERDYVMRVIKDLARFLAKALLNKETVVYELPYEANYTSTDYLHKHLVSLISQGRINEAENLLFDKLEPKNKRYMELCLDFYERLNSLDDEFLEKNNFTREEIAEGLKVVAKKFGIPI